MGAFSPPGAELVRLLDYISDEIRVIMNTEDTVFSSGDDAGGFRVLRSLHYRDSKLGYEPVTGFCGDLSVNGEAATCSPSPHCEMQ